MSDKFFDAHKDTLSAAVSASDTREYWSPYSEMPSPKVYGETGAADGEAAFKAYLGKAFEIDQPSTGDMIGDEASPFGIELGTSYPAPDVDALIAASTGAGRAWGRASIEARVGVCMEALARINARSFEMAHAVMHTTGQAYMMAFQAGGPHAQDRALEAVAYAWREMTRTPATARWEKPQGKCDPLVMEKKFYIVPRGIGLVIGCATFPTWNSYPGIFADLATGNSVIVKPHPKAILPLAISVTIIREVLVEAGFDANVITLAVDTLEAPIAADLAVRPEIRLVDFTGGSEFGNWLEGNARQALVFTEKSGVNSIVIDSTDNIKGLIGNLAFTLSLYSGQMCTTTQDIFVPEGGIETDEGHKSFDEVAEAIAGGVEAFLADDARAVHILGAIQADATMERIAAAEATGKAILKSRAVTHPDFAEARVQTPVIIKTDAGDSDLISAECFGPVSYIIATADTAASLEIVRKMTQTKGALSFGVYSTSEEVLEAAEDVAMDGGVAVSMNLTGGVFVNQTAAFSDYHGTGANPAANAALSDAAYVASRFRVVQSRRHAA